MKLPSISEVRKPSKTLAGVTPIAVMLAPRKCRHGTCLYCPSLSVPQSYTPLSPPVIRARMLDYNPKSQVEVRLKAFRLMNHPTDKIEMIVMGGTFLSYPKKYRENFIKLCYDALNRKKSRNLEEAKTRNESARHRLVALCIETRPDFCAEKHISEMLRYGCTRVELGVQAIDDKIYKLVNRGHNVQDVIDATKRLKDAGFKVGYHIMPGIPGSNQKKDMEMFRNLFKDTRFKPDQLKIYPCQVIKGSALEKWHQNGRYNPYTKEQIQSLLIKMYQLVPDYVRIMRIMREIPPEFLVAGTIRIDLRKDVEQEIRRRKIKINEIRFREIGFRIRDKKAKEKINKNLKLKIIRYKASGGDEYFLQFVNKDSILFGLLRLRIANKKAFVRELHVYGASVPIGLKGKFAKKTVGVHAQHKGLGKKLMEVAEKTAKENKIKELRVISGVGVREYYRQLGYRLDKEGYMAKNLN